MKKKITVKISKEKECDWNNLLEILVNQQREDFFLTDSGTTIILYPKNSDWSIRFEKNGNWSLE